MWAPIVLSVLVTGSLAFLGYFEFAMIRELRRVPKQWKLISRLESNWSQDARQRIVVFELTPPERRSQAARAAR